MLSNISAVFTDKGDGEKAEEYALRALEIYSQFVSNRPPLFLGYGLKIIVNLVSIYKKTLGLSSEELKIRLSGHLERMVGKKLTKSLLDTIAKHNDLQKNSSKE